MNRILKLFAEKKKNILSIYFTAGYPDVYSTGTILNALQQHGADMIEIGMPYSDPLADGPVIQQSSMQALQNGMTIRLLFEQLKHVRDTVSVPLVLMGYLNPVMQYGFENFCRHALEAGIDGIILPDLPMHEYETEFREIFDKYQLDFVFLITPETSEERIRKIDALSKGFIYAVSSSSITGTNKDMREQENYFKRISAMQLVNPVMIGFGIKDHTTFSQACEHAAGAIIGTAYIKSLEKSVNIEDDTKHFLDKILHPAKS